jgi:L-Ala-D/L-Glu epimerase
VPDARWKVEVFQADLPLVEKFEIARETWHSARNVFVKITYGGEFGVGEAGPASRWGETPESVIAQIENVNLSMLATPFDFEMLANLLPPGSARSAVDIALHDLSAKLAGISVSDLLGTSPDDQRPSTSVTVPIAHPSQMVDRALRFSDHPVLKMKVGFDGDFEAVAAVREVFTGAIRIDANEGWSTDDAISRLRKLEPLNIELCEQPIPAGNLDDLRLIATTTSIPIYADEDVSTARDVAQLAGVVDGVNLKLRKAGGIRETVKAIAVARSHGMGVMLGCDLDTGVAATAGAHVAALVDHVDLDGPLLLAKDPYPGVAYRRGAMLVPDGPGLGLKENPLDD